MKIFIATAVLLFSIFSHAQNIGIGTTTPNPNAAVDITDTTRGILIPRMDSTHRMNMLPVAGMLVYDSTTQTFWYHNGATWRSLLNSAIVINNSGNYWSLDGNTASVSDINFLGTTNSTPLNFKVFNQKAGKIDHNNFNVFLGFRAGNSSLNGSALGNSALGHEALLSNQTGSGNVAIGGRALYTSISASDNVAVGSQALYSNTSGNQNVAVGAEALYTNGAGSNNTAAGFRALNTNSSGSNNSAIGSFSLFQNMSGSFNAGLGDSALYSNYNGNFNTATGVSAMNSNGSGNSNSAYGYQSLFINSSGTYNTAVGVQSLYSNTTSNFNTAAGYQALYGNIDGIENSAFGQSALRTNVSGNFNTAAGTRSLFNNMGSQNTAVGGNSLQNNQAGSNNVAIGFNAGSNLTNGHYNIMIGAATNGLAADNGVIRIGSNIQTKAFMSGIYGQTTGGAGIAVYIDNNGQLGTNPSSGRFKEQIEELNSGDQIYSLRPVSFRYRNELFHVDSSLQYGLIAEEVEKINPNLVAYGKDGEVFTVRYQFLTPLLIAALQKERRQNEELRNKMQILEAALKSQQLQIAGMEERISALDSTRKK
jgi:hypothetical protein